MTSLVATPSVLAPPGLGGGVRRTWTEHVVPQAADSIGSVYRMARLPSSARIMGASRLIHTAITTATSTFDIGVYNIPGKTNITDSATGINTGVVASTAGTKALLATTTNAGKRLWEFTTATADPKCDLDICLTLASLALVSPSGPVHVEIEYSFD
jgi:hypothetical protein